MKHTLILTVGLLILTGMGLSDTLKTSGTVQAISAMHTPRADHTMTPLPNGTILIVGGMTGAAQPAGVELFDPKTRRFQALDTPMVRRFSHTATLLPSGQVLVTGGYDAEGRYLTRANLYNPQTQAFTATGAMTTARANHAATLLRDGRVLLMGGTGTGWTFLSSAEIYNPKTGTFQATGAMQHPRESHVAVRLENGKVLVVGGHVGRRSDTHIYRSAELYNPQTGRFRTTGAMQIKRHKHDAVLLPDGDVLILGGADERDSQGVYKSVERYNSKTGLFAKAGHMKRGRYKHAGTSIVLSNGHVLIAGGATQAEIYDPKTQRFALVGGDTQMVGQFSATAALDADRVLITGGYSLGQAPQPNGWLYKPNAH